MPRSGKTSTFTHMNAVWLDQLGEILSSGDTVSPRGKETRELLHSTITVDMAQPVLTVPERRLNYQFMAAEAYWILSGDNTVDGIAPWNKHISQFSDDGKIFAGAYGPRVVDQLDYVLDKLREDPDTRQAGLTIWTPNPPPSKDIPCTVAIWFQIRGTGRIRDLNVSVFMRSSDVWLGLPYDVFNFSMLGYLVAGHLNSSARDGMIVLPNQLSLTAASSHLYATNFEAAAEVLKAALQHGVYRDGWTVPSWMYNDPQRLMETLKTLRDSKPGDVIRWWEGK